MQEPAESDPAPPIEAVIEVSYTTIDLETADSSTGAQILADGEAPLADEPLNRLERIAATFGAWIVTFAERLHIQSGPSFVVDGRPVGDLLDPTPFPTEDGPPLRSPTSPTLLRPNLDTPAPCLRRAGRMDWHPSRSQARCSPSVRARDACRH